MSKKSSRVFQTILSLELSPLGDQIRCSFDSILNRKIRKVNSVQEAGAKCSEVHILKFEILQIKNKKQKKPHQTLNLQFFFMWFARFPIFMCELQSI